MIYGYQNKNYTINLMLIMLMILLIGNDSFGQKKKISLSVQYAPNLSKITSKFKFGKYKLSHIGLIEMQYKISNNILPTVGIGFMSTGETSESIIIRSIGNTSIKSKVSYKYMIVPIGVKLKFSSIFIKPAFGFAYYLSNKNKIISIDENGVKTKRNEEVETQGEVAFNKLTIPVFLTIGKEFRLNKLKVETGVKGYYGLQPIVINTAANSVKSKFNKYVGVGLFFAIRI